MLGDVCRLAIGRMDSFAPPPLSKWRYDRGHCPTRAWTRVAHGRDSNGGTPP
jgi:hypothetical protein